MKQQAEKLRVGIIAPCPPPFGGIVRIVENHLAYWDPAEIEAHFIPMYPPEKPEPVGEAPFYDLANAGSKNYRGLAEYARCYARQPLTRAWVYRHFWQYNTGLSALIEQKKLNVIYAHEVWPAGASAVLQGRIHGIASVVVTYGETWHTTPEYERWGRVEPYVFSADRLISTSEHCRNGALARGADASRHSVVYAGIDLDRFRPGLDGSDFRQRYAIPADAFVISSLGLSLRRKLDTLLDALSNLTAASDVYCLIGGAGPDSDYVAERSAAIKGVQVKQLGFVSEAELPAFYAATDVLVVSPRTLLECMGQSMKEAMACGKAVVGADIGGIPEAISDGENGLLYRADDSTDLCRALQAFISNRALCNEYGAVGRKFAEAKFDAGVSAVQTRDIFRDAVTASRTRR